MYQVTAVYDNAEIGYGEGDGFCYACDECEASIPEIFRPVLDDVVLIVIHPNGRVRKLNL